MAGILKVDQVQSDSNLAFAIAGSNVAFMNATSLQMVGSNVSLAGTNVITNGKVVSSGMPTGAVLQVVSYDYTGSTSYSVSNSSAQTPCAVSITPSSTSSKILIIGRLTMGGSATYIGGGATIYRNSTLLSQGTAGSTFNTTSGYVNPPYINASDTYDAVSVPLSFLDSPSTTSAITYYLGVSGISGVGVVYVNRGSNGQMGYTSNIICMEIAG
jgi:hypothetical protein